MTGDRRLAGMAGRRLRGPMPVVLKRAAAVTVAVALAAALAGCAAVPSSGRPPAGTSGPLPTPGPGSIASAPPSLSAAPTPSSSLTAETRPPTVGLRDAGGRVVAGQVGTFQWAGVVSSSPLLPGAPATVGPRQALAITSDGPSPSSWRATLYRDPADSTSGRLFGEGIALVGLRAPTEPGIWTLALRLVYPDGDVIHFWRLTVKV